MSKLTLNLILGGFLLVMAAISVLAEPIQEELTYFDLVLNKVGIVNVLIGQAVLVMSLAFVIKIFWNGLAADLLKTREIDIWNGLSIALFILILSV